MYFTENRYDRSIESMMKGIPNFYPRGSGVVVTGKFEYTADIRFFDMFSGIGGFRSGLEAVGGFECIGHCEIDPYPNTAYNAIFDTRGEYYCDDARKINPDEMPDFDLLCAGFPCQSFSVAGRRLGFEDTRGTLFFEVARLLKAKRPAFFLLENVVGLLSHDEGRTLETIYSALIEVGYCFEWCVLDSRYYVPQQRKRLRNFPRARTLCQKELDVICAKHVLWLNDAGGEQAHLSNCVLKGLFLRGRDLSHAYCNYTVFDDCNLDSVDFSSAELESARFTNCEMKDLLLNSRPEFKSVEYADGELNAVIADEYCDEAIGEESGMSM